MEAIDLYNQLEKDFITTAMSDDWAAHMEEVSEFLCPNYKSRSMGLVCDFAGEIDSVFTAVFPSKHVLQVILNSGVRDALLFVHHAAEWDIRNTSGVWLQMDPDLLRQLKSRRISVYNLHVPLDNFGNYSTSVSLAKALEIKPQKAFAPYFGALCGVLGHTRYRTIQELQKHFSKTVGHDTRLYDYGDDVIIDGTVAVVAGGGLMETIEEVVQKKANVFVTGISTKSEYSQKAHQIAEQNRINILGGTHYSTEKFACISMCQYFRELGLPVEFIEGEPVLEDM
ncbi:MAG: Nif3-like dinuclear metal center hexameric protein [Spirochaetales bacterium]|nr:Nif3-like dinuclear metal center hexameric protein [Spirochaetales bacterium]